MTSSASTASGTSRQSTAREWTGARSGRAGCPRLSAPRWSSLRASRWPSVKAAGHRGCITSSSKPSTGLPPVTRSDELPLAHQPSGPRGDTEVLNQREIDQMGSTRREMIGSRRHVSRRVRSAARSVTPCAYGEHACRHATRTSFIRRRRERWRAPGALRLGLVRQGSASHRARLGTPLESGPAVRRRQRPTRTTHGPTGRAARAPEHHRCRRTRL
jgi:hypothetical protein